MFIVSLLGHGFFAPLSTKYIIIHNHDWKKKRFFPL